MTSELRQTLSMIAECPVCREPYTTAAKKPKLLTSCGHTMCLECVAAHCRCRFVSNTGDRVACPICRRPVRLPTGGFTALPNNLTMMKLLDIRHLLNRCDSREELQSALDLVDRMTDCENRLCRVANELDSIKQEMRTALRRRRSSVPPTTTPPAADQPNARDHRPLRSVSVGQVPVLSSAPSDVSLSIPTAWYTPSHSQAPPPQPQQAHHQQSLPTLRQLRSRRMAQSPAASRSSSRTTVVTSFPSRRRRRPSSAIAVSPPATAAVTTGSVVEPRPSTFTRSPTFTLNSTEVVGGAAALAFLRDQSQSPLERDGAVATQASGGLRFGAVLKPSAGAMWLRRVVCSLLVLFAYLLFIMLIYW